MRAVVFHNVVTDPLDVFDRELYRTHRNGFCNALRSFGKEFRLISLAEMLQRLDAGEPLRNGLTLTFDDGFAGVYEQARPLLAQLGVPATVFLVTERSARAAEGAADPARLLHFEILEIAFRLTSRRELDLSRYQLGTVALSGLAERAHGMARLKHAFKRLPAAESEAVQQQIIEAMGVDMEQVLAYAAQHAKYRKLSGDQVRTLIADGWTVGGHTRSHPALSSVDAARLEDETRGNLRDLTAAYGLVRPPFAYPYGGPELIGHEAAEAVRTSGFGCAFTTVLAPLEPATDRFLLGRYGEKDLLHGIP